MEPELTLDKAKRLVRQREAIKEQQETLRKPYKGEGALDSVVRQAPRRKLPAIPAGAPMQQNIRLCIRCGKNFPPPNICVPLKKLCVSAVTEKDTSAASACQIQLQVTQEASKK